MKRNILMAMMAALPLIAVAQEYELPTMGWSSWNTYGFRISESIIKKQADAMVSKGLKKVGYQYINIDDGYFGGRDENGHLLIHPERFPNGMKPVVDYIHKKGLKAGIYSDGGHNTCASFHGGDTWGVGVGLYEHDQIDCDFFFKELDFDFIKVDFCGGADYHNNDGNGGHDGKTLILDERKRYTEIHQAIVNTGKEGVRLNVCRWAFPGTWVHDIATSWRTTGDIGCWWTSVRDIIKENLYLSAYATEGHYNDMDMLEVGRGLSAEEDKTHFGMWCIMASPLLIGCDMTTINTTTLNLLKNKELIALNQDPLALQAYVVQHKDGAYVLVKDIEQAHSGIRAVAFYNPTDEKVTTSIDFATLDLGGEVNVRDLFAKKDKGVMTGSMSVDLPAHGTRIYRLEAAERYERTLYEAETAWLGQYQEISWPTTGSYDEAEFCSGGVKCGWLGGNANNDLQWRDVYTIAGGEYSLKLSYICGENRKTTIEVNGEKVKTLTLNSGSWQKVKTTTVKVTLKPGNNIVRLYNASGYMPDIDCMTLECLTPGSPVETIKGNGRVDVHSLAGVCLRRDVAADKALEGMPRGTYVVGCRIVVKH